MILHLKIIGSLLMVLSFIHIGFPRYFKWKEELNSLSLINRQMMQTHTFFIALMVFMVGLLSMSCSEELVNTQFGRNISLGLAFFWLLRLVFQLFIYSTKLWRGKAFETIIHLIFTLFWVYMVWVYLKIYLG